MNGYSYITILIKVTKVKVTSTARGKKAFFHFMCTSSHKNKLAGGVRTGLEKITKHIRRLLDKPQK